MDCLRGVRAAKDPYAGLLTSLHVLALSVMVIDQAPETSNDSWSLENPATRFAVVKFQHKQIELQEQLRQKLGLRSDRHTANKQPREASEIGRSVESEPAPAPGHGLSEPGTLLHDSALPHDARAFHEARRSG